MMYVFIYLVVCVWIHGRCLHVQLGLRRLNYHIVHIVATRRCGRRLRIVVMGDMLFRPDNQEVKTRDKIRVDPEGLKG